MLEIPALAGNIPGKGASELMTACNKNEIDEKYKENGLVIGQPNCACLARYTKSAFSL